VAEGLAQAEAPSSAGIPRTRLLMAGAAVVVLLAVVVGGALLLLGEKQPWSDWKPKASSDPNVVMHEIASHVGPRYRLANGVALAGSLDTSRLLLGNEQITAIVLDPGMADQQLVAQPTPTDTVQFTFCGSGPICALPRRGAAVETVARSEALELALYAFKYVPAVNTVVVTLPPRAGEATSQALVVTRTDAQRSLSHPLKDSLGWVDPPRADRIDAALATKAAAITAPHVFRYEEGQDAGGRYAMAIYQR
jgi:hypothetical protein